MPLGHVTAFIYIIISLINLIKLFLYILGSSWYIGEKIYTPNLKVRKILNTEEDNIRRYLTKNEDLLQWEIPCTNALVYVQIGY